jgi:hypothetical protein
VKPLQRKGLATGIHQYKTEAQAGINFQMTQFKLPRDDAEIGYHASVKALAPALQLPNQAALDVAFKEIALRVEKARTTVRDLRVVDETLRNELVKEGFFDQLGK